MNNVAPLDATKYSPQEFNIISPFTKQIDAYEAVQNHVQTLYGGAIRGGKTYFVLLQLFALAMEYDNSRWLALRADMPRFELTTLRTFEEMLDSGLGQYIVRWHKGLNVVTWLNGSQFIFMAENYARDKDLNRLKGFECNGAGLDEVNELQEVTYDKVIERSGTWFHAKPNIFGEKCPIKIISSCNPTTNWVKKRFYDPWKSGKGLPAGSVYIPSKITDNPFVPSHYLESLKQNMPFEKYMRFVEGDWEYAEKTGNEWIDKFDYLKHTTDVPYIASYPTKLGFDFNLRPYQTMLNAQVVAVGEWIEIRIYDEYCSEPPNNYPEYACEQFINDYLRPYGFAAVDFYGDASGKHGTNAYRGIETTLARYVHQGADQVLSRNPFVNEARDLMNEILTETIYKIRIRIDRQRCPNLIQDLDSLQTGINGFDPQKVDGVETRGHCYSALVYIVCKIYYKLLKSQR